MDNPLADAQREKKGAETFGKYEYQYHWALWKMLTEHKDRKEYAIFVELHEDVVFSTSLEKDTAEFEFYQIKENSGSGKYTQASLTKVKRGSKNSVLGKLIESYKGKVFKDIISTANLVATSGFSNEMVKKNLDLDTITIGDLQLKKLAKFKKCILEELKLEECPVNIRFIVPRLMAASQRDTVIATLVDLISSVYPNSQCDASNIYRVLIDELHRKGQVVYDYSKWDALLKDKALTSKTVQETIEAHSSIKGLEEIENNAKEFIGPFDFPFLKRKEIIESVNRFYTKKIGENSSFNIRFSKEVSHACDGHKHLDNKALLLHIEDTLTDELKNSINREHELRAAIICEIITGDI